MGQKNDIGTLFENKLNDGKKIPNKSLWEKINISLDEEKRKRKRILFYWVTGGSLSVLLGLFLLFGNGNFLLPNSHLPENKPNSNKPSNISSEKENNKTSFQFSTEDSLILKNESEEKLSRTTAPIEYSNLNTTEKISKTKQQADSEKHFTKKSSQPNNTDENFTISKSYYYYNSRDGKRMVTTNKQEIDSLISEQNKSLDSTITKKTDSLK